MVPNSILLKIIFASFVMNAKLPLPEVAKREGENTLVDLVKKAGLVDTLTKTKDLTLFGPTDAAFSALPPGLFNAIKNNKAFLQKVLEYHVIGKVVKSGDITNDLLIGSLVPNASIRFNVYDKKDGKKIYTASGRPINLKKVDIEAQNGIFHELEGVMLPPVGNMAKAVSGCPKLKSLTKYLVEVGLDKTLSGDGPFTVFTPTDAAFAKVPSAIIDVLKNNKTLVKEVLLYHVVGGTYYSAGLSSGNVKTVNGKDVIVQVDGSAVKINEANVIAADVTVTNGVAHAIDQVLLPPGLSFETTVDGASNKMYFERKTSSKKPLTLL